MQRTLGLRCHKSLRSRCAKMRLAGGDLFPRCMCTLRASKAIFLRRHAIRGPLSTSTYLLFMHGTNKQIICAYPEATVPSSGLGELKPTRALKVQTLGCRVRSARAHAYAKRAPCARCKSDHVHSSCSIKANSLISQKTQGLLDSAYHHAHCTHFARL